MPSSEDTPLRLLRRDDFPALADLLNEVWPEEEWELRFRRQWLDNPAQREDLAMGWVLERKGELHAFFGSIPLPYRVAGAPGTAVASTALYVRQDLRASGLGTALIDAWCEQPGCELWVTTTSNAPSARILDRRGIPFLLREERESHHMLTVRPWCSAQRALRERFGANRLLGAILCPLGGLRAIQLSLAARGLRRGSEAYACHREKEAPADLDELWKRLAPRFPTTFRRDARTLRWLLFESPRAERNHLLTCRDRSGALIAWAAFRALPERGELRQVDAFGDWDDPEVLRALAREAAESARRAGLEQVRLWTADRAQAAVLEQAGLRSTPCVGRVHYHFRDLEHADRVYFTDIDGDKVLNTLL